jgi:hypothetical protein
MKQMGIYKKVFKKAHTYNSSINVTSVYLLWENNYSINK